MEAGQKEFKTNPPSLLDKDLLMEDTEAQRKQKRTRRSGVFFLLKQQKKYTRCSSWRNKTRFFSGNRQPLQRYLI
jgi:hypothetical protein